MGKVNRITAECRNCRRKKQIQAKGLCALCYNATREAARDPTKTEDGELRVVADRLILREMDKVARKHPNMPSGSDNKFAKPYLAKKRKIHKVVRGLRKRLDSKPAVVYPISPEIVQVNPPEVRYEGEPPPPKPIIMHIRFDAADRLLLDDFKELCRRKRRQPADQILAMIEEVVSDERALQKEFGRHT